MFALPSTLTLALLAAAPALSAEAPAAPPSNAVVAEAPPAPPAPAAPLGTPRSELLLGDWGGAEKPVTLDLDRVRTRDALAQLAAQAGWSLAFEDRPDGRVDMSFSGIPADQALLAILREQGLVARREGSLITIKEADERLGADHDEDEPDVAGGPGRVSIGRSVKVAAGETVREAVSVGGSVEVDGTVLKDAVSIGGKVKLGPNAVVRGSAVSVGGGLDIAPGASVGRDRVSIGPGFTLMPWGKDEAPAPAEPEEPKKSWAAEQALSVGGKALHSAIFFVLGLLLLALFPERMKAVHRELTHASGPCAAVGVVGLMATPLLMVLLCLTVVGIPIAVLVLPLAIGVGLLFGFTALSLWIGARFPTRNPRRSQVVALALGALVLFVVRLVPFLGGLAMFVLGLFAFGAVLRTRFGSGPRNDANFVPTP